MSSRIARGAVWKFCTRLSEFLVIEQVALARTDVGVGEGAVYLGFSVSTHFPSCQYFPFWVISRILISGLKLVAEGFAVVAGVAVHDVEGNASRRKWCLAA